MFQSGREVILTQKPDGCTTRFCPWEVGQKLTIKYIDGCCLCVTDGKEDWTISSQRFELVT